MLPLSAASADGRVLLGRPFGSEAAVLGATFRVATARTGQEPATDDIDSSAADAVDAAEGVIFFDFTRRFLAKEDLVDDGPAVAAWLDAGGAAFFGLPSGFLAGFLAEDLEDDGTAAAAWLIDAGVVEFIP